jgi:hypothetical protein
LQLEKGSAKVIKMFFRYKTLLKQDISQHFSSTFNRAWGTEIRNNKTV